MKTHIAPARYRVRLMHEGDMVEGYYDPVTHTATGSLGRFLSAQPDFAAWLRHQVASAVIETTVVVDGGPEFPDIATGDLLGAFRDWALYAKKAIGNWQNYKLLSPFGRTYYFAVDQSTGRIGGKGLPHDLPEDVAEWLRGMCGFANPESAPAQCRA